MARTCRALTFHPTRLSKIARNHMYAITFSIIKTRFKLKWLISNLISICDQIRWIPKQGGLCSGYHTSRKNPDHRDQCWLWDGIFLDPPILNTLSRLMFKPIWTTKVAILKDGQVWSEKVAKIYRYRKKGIRYRAMVGPFNFGPALSGNWTCFAAYANLDENGQKRVETISKSIRCMWDYSE